MDYFVVKTIHQGAVVLSICGFFARGVGALTGAAWVQRRAAKTLPHLVDTVLLLSALALAWMLQLHPGNAPWLLAKIIGLLAYIGLGMLALKERRAAPELVDPPGGRAGEDGPGGITKPGRPMPLRAAAWIAALVTFGWIVSVAISKQPLGFVAGL